ncbi:MAG: hypothetical protein A2667_00130 [Candidatus Wildermuthbacteria bacterium RIFCSPHIGHO2_01_FULL_47_27]|uniref:DUF3137 domain-containing protein n=1 Tax=Candidatus Wildermuthbacteria bacterium RIFCSPHIGHO2_02_FULL_47_17 TaxID=1802452 RepID=A0A1G2R8M8_9BACT|nr:MAG: hypothetical protein UY15_C0011G0010 [Parcubacteria group bacterium GW2011_GWA2_47_9]OHA64597.1 MAG: hypothetical protein A2667_00130 [Candidatus Wildermuthbacteria bacterium RIFCSPHIGHO2_01_FULL_47_27]OHA68908.1 MAG: hypothetical protein A3D59_00405 [Candidatus Wildermuthbacteria bacterium RIFCSPHIGHO2_02_FULL_47_17]OHA75423.1 MAG: hypothetical protein A3I38_01915 [Candidatus Wildermuthbacteria bacterium RIFCSPLOWO2_02_FULL_47_10]
MESKHNLQEVSGFEDVVSINPDKLPAIAESIEDVIPTTNQYILKHYFWQAVLLTLVSLVLTIFLLNFAGKELGELTLLPLAVPFIAYGWCRDRIQGVFMQQFACANGFNYQRHGPHQISEEGSIFNRGRAQKIFNIVDGTFLHYPLRLFNYRHTIGSGRQNKTFQYTVFELVFAANLPKIYLDAHKSSTEKVSGWRIAGAKRIELESNDFNKQFSLWIEEGRHIEALQIFAPDFMDELLHLPGKFDLEIIGNQIYIYDDGIIRTKARLREMFQLAKHLMENLGYVLEQMRVSRGRGRV